MRSSKEYVQDFMDTFVTRSIFGVSIGALDSFKGLAEGKVRNFLLEREKEIVGEIKKLREEANLGKLFGHYAQNVGAFETLKDLLQKLGE